MNKKPADYVAIQARYNYMHTDGSFVGGRGDDEPMEHAVVAASRLAKALRVASLPQTSFLDVGCRIGYVAVLLSEIFPNADVLAVDVVPEFVECAANHIPAAVADMHDMPFIDDREYDWVFCYQTLEHAYDVPKALAELTRVANCGVYVSLPVETKANFVNNKSHYYHTYDIFEWMRMLAVHADNFALADVVRRDTLDFVLLRHEHMPENGFMRLLEVDVESTDCK